MVRDDGISKTLCNSERMGFFKMNNRHIVNLFFSAFILCIEFACKAAEETSYEIVNVVGEIFSDSISDNKSFKLCKAEDRIIQYYAFQEKTYATEKSDILASFFEQYIPVANDDSGLIRIRFVVNCNGKSGRFRILGMNKNYQKKDFSNDITSQLLRITKNLNGWKPMKANGLPFDYYQYLIFKIENGQLLEIMP